MQAGSGAGRRLNAVDCLGLSKCGPAVGRGMPARSMTQGSPWHDAREGRRLLTASATQCRLRL